jgi:hypothetical protein
MKGRRKPNELKTLQACVLMGFLMLVACSPPSTVKSPLSEPDGRPETQHMGRNGMLTGKEMELARTAWKYFENNTQPNTGLANSGDQYPSTTMWDTASYLGGLVAALELDIIVRDQFHQRLTTLLNTLNHLAFFRDELPNKAYNSRTAEKVNYNNQPGEIGFSALDLGRLLIWLRIIKERYPEYADAIDRFVLRWDFRNVLDRNGSMYGAVLDSSGRTRYLQEGRLGYEEYAARGFQLWGFDTSQASMLEPYGFVKIYGIEIPYDTRDPRELGAHNYVVSESYVLDAIELNRDPKSDDKTHGDATKADFADRIYRVQEERSRRTGILTARTEHQLDGPPYFVYDTIYTDGCPWNTITEDGKYVPQFAALSTKAAFGLWALWETSYTDSLFQTASSLYDPERGFYEGRCERDGGLIKAFTANSNGIILETLLYKVQGKLLRFGNRPGLWERTSRQTVMGPGKVPPADTRKSVGNSK